MSKLERLSRIPLHDHADNNSGGKIDGGSVVAAVGGGDSPPGITAHTQLTGVTSDQHHAQSHNHSASDDGTSLSPATLVLPAASSPSQTAEGSAVWDSDDDTLTVGTGASRKEFGYLGSSAPSGGYGTAASGSSKEVLRKDAVLAKPTAGDVDFSADVTTNNASTSAHGLLKKLPNDAALFFDGQGNFSPLNISGVNLASGTSFPGSPATNDVFFRTDRGILYFYDGTRWLSVHLHQVPLTVYDQFDGTTTSPRDKSVALPNSDAIYLISGVVAGIVTGTNNGSNYWSFQFKTKSAPNTDTNRGSAVNTSGDSVSTYFNKEVSIGVALTTAALVGFCTAGKTGTPGNMYYFPTIKYRLIG